MEILLYIACSLDGYIATRSGGVDWLASVETEGEDYGYAAFFDSVDALVMGRHSYEQIRQFGDWPYGDKPCRVMSRRPLSVEQPGVTVTDAPLEQVLAALAEEGVKRLWLVGGSALIATFEKAGCIDEYIVSLVPQLLGDGIPLFAAGAPARALTLLSCQRYPSGLVQLHYRKAPKS